MCCRAGAVRKNTAAVSDSKAPTTLPTALELRRNTAALRADDSLGAHRLDPWPINSGMIRRLGIEVTVLLVPHLFIDIAPLQQFLVSADVVQLAPLEDHDCIGLNQHRQSM